MHDDAYERIGIEGECFERVSDTAVAMVRRHSVVTVNEVECSGFVRQKKIGRLRAEATAERP